MQRLTQPKSLCQLFLVIAVLAAGTGIQDARSAPPNVVHANIDYNASGYVTPAGMVPPHLYQGGVMPVGYFNSGGYASGCDSGCESGCDSGCDSPAGCSTGGGRCGCPWNVCKMLASGGLLGKLNSGTNACGGCGASGCDSCGGLNNYRHLCLFCQGNGCSACQFWGRGYLLGALSYLRPYGDAGLCSQRWYDLSAELVFLGHNTGGQSGVVARQGGPTAPVALSFGDVNSGGDMETGVRFSAAMIWGPGGNIEGTYFGGSEWSSSAIATGPPLLNSFITDFGTGPSTGLDDVDNSLVQRLDSRSNFHSGELNYRRRTVGPYCRFQGSWLLGLRYLQYDDRLIYTTGNDTLNNFFSSNQKNQNRLFGPQIGMDLWWNIHPGVSFGIGAKGAWMRNDVDRRTRITGNSFPTVAAPAGRQDNTVMGEFETKLVYRLTHSFSFRTAYYAVAVDDIAFGSIDANAIRALAVGQNARQGIQLDSLVVQGFSFGTEYIW